MAMYKTTAAFLIALRKTIGKSVSKKNMLELGKLAVKQVVKRTRKGLGANRTNAQEKPLKPLSPNYIAKRRKSKLDKTTKPSKSNLTFTGQLLRSMRVKEVTNRGVRWGANRRRRKGGLTNERLADIVSEQRPFNNLSKQDIDKLAKYLDKNLARLLKKL